MRQLGGYIVVEALSLRPSGEFSIIGPTGWMCYCSSLVTAFELGVTHHRGDWMDELL